jgi:hypothetical protein
LPVAGHVVGILRDWWDDDRKPETRVGGRAIWAGQVLIWSRPSLRAISLLCFFYSEIQLSVSAFTVAMLVTDLGWTPIRAGGVAAVVQVCGAVGRISWGIVADVLGAGFLVLSGLGVASGLLHPDFVERQLGRRSGDRRPLRSRRLRCGLERDGPGSIGRALDVADTVAAENWARWQKATQTWNRC